METHKGLAAFTPRSAGSWRNWLRKNHAARSSVWLVLYRKDAGEKTISHEQAVEEALCFGWIDSVVNKRDAYSRYQYFTPRKPKSTWSKKNREAVLRLTREGRMEEPGLKMVALAKKSGSWRALDKIDRMVMPDDLAAALRESSAASEHWKGFPPSAVKRILFWIESAKKPETRAKRIRETVRLAARKIRAPRRVRKPLTR